MSGMAEHKCACRLVLDEALAELAALREAEKAARAHFDDYCVRQSCPGCDDLAVALDAIDALRRGGGG